MSTPLDLPASQLLAFPRESLMALRAAFRRDASDGGAMWLQEGGYAAGAPVFDAFCRWAVARGVGDPTTLGVAPFRELAAEFFRDGGWGDVQITGLDGVVAAIDAPDWAEAEPDAALPYPGCHYSAGLLADFFGRVGEAPLAALEVECRSAGSERCRFLLGSEAVMSAIYERMVAGVDYQTAITELR